MNNVESPGNPILTPDAQTDDLEAAEAFPDSTDMDLCPGVDNCYKCTTCGVSCPVTEAGDEFPGPKFQGPEQWRLKRKEGEAVDDSIVSRSNCIRYDDVRPSGVPLSQMHNTARDEYADEQMDKLSREYIRNRILANYGTPAQLGGMFLRLANAVMGNSVVQRINKKVLGITAGRDSPEFAIQTFREQWNKCGGLQVRSDEKHVAYFHGCHSNYNTPEVDKAMVRVFESFGYEIVVPKQRCSGTPMFANGMLDDAKRTVGVNVDNSAGLIPEGHDIIASCASCPMSLRQEYPEPFDIDDIEDPSAYTYEALEYLRIHEDLKGVVRGVLVDGQAFAYHASCYGRNQGLDRQATELFRQLDGVEAEDVGDSCSGISGTYGWKGEKYDKSMQIGVDMLDHIEYAQGSVGMTECPTCLIQMECGTGYDIKHPFQLPEGALV